MKKLERSNEPKCLKQYDYKKNNWEGVTIEAKKEIWEQLGLMQEGFCAYCESKLEDDDRHIEHFIPRSKQPMMTFQWENLFGSCNNNLTCGRHKDRNGIMNSYVPKELIKPDKDDPNDYLHFSSSGTISPKEYLSDKDKHKAKETIRVFNLSHFNEQRRWHINPFFNQANILLEKEVEILDLSKESQNDKDIKDIEDMFGELNKEWDELIRTINETPTPFRSAIIQIIEGMKPRIDL